MQRCRVADFLKELPVAVARTEPALEVLHLQAQPLDKVLRVKELQTNLVYTTVLAKKCKVRPTAALCCFVVVPQVRQGSASCPPASLKPQHVLWDTQKLCRPSVGCGQ